MKHIEKSTEINKLTKRGLFEPSSCPLYPFIPFYTFTDCKHCGSHDLTGQLYLMVYDAGTQCKVLISKGSKGSYTPRPRTHVSSYRQRREKQLLLNTPQRQPQTTVSGAQNKRAQKDATIEQESISYPGR